MQGWSERYVPRAGNAAAYWGEERTDGENTNRGI